jgi:hypothetical protein
VDGDRQHDRGAQRDPRAERRMDEHADEAPPSEAGALGERHERDRIVREAERVEDASGLTDDRAGDRLDDPAREAVDGIRGRLVSRVLRAERAIRGPERPAAVADHDDSPGLRREVPERVLRGDARVVRVRRGRADEVQADARERRRERAHQRVVRAGDS